MVGLSLRSSNGWCFCLVFWVGDVVGARDAGGFPAGVIGGGVGMSYELSDIRLSSTNFPSSMMSL